MVNLVTGNIKSNPLMRQSRVLSDVEEVASVGGVILWQEITPPRYKDAIRQKLPIARWTHRQLPSSIPISTRDGAWEVLDSGIVKTHNGRRAVSPNRYVSWVLARRRGTNKIIAFINSHFISGAWSRGYRLAKRWRRRAWNYHYNIMKTMVTRFIKAGITVIGGGDWNRRLVDKFVTAQRWLNRGSIDYLFVAEAANGVKVRLVESDRRNLYSDHNALIARIRLFVRTGYVAVTKVPSFDDLKPMPH